MAADEEHQVELQRVDLFLDESGTSSAESLTLVGAVAFQDTQRAEQLIKAAYERALGDASLWPNAEKRLAFSEVGFHFTEDSESVKQILLTLLGELEFRAYVAFARNDPSSDSVERLVAMYGTLLSSVFLRYRDAKLTVVFEENSSMDRLYGKLWQVLTSDISLPHAAAYRGSKAVPCLAVIDYVLGVTRIHLAGGAHDFQENRYVALGRNLAYLIDFDDDRHLGGRRHPIV